MGFYKSISEVYTQIFPLNPGQISFTNRAFTQTRNLSLLDIGCGTGSLSLALASHFSEDSFDGIVCYGNTLVHLASLEQISRFFEACKSLLKPQGKLLIQIIHYDRILDHHIPALPTIETDQILFIRNYHYHPERHQIDFETILTIKQTEQVIRNSVALFPVRKTELEKALNEAGFNHLSFYGSFKAEALSPESIPLLIEAT